MKWILLASVVVAAGLIVRALHQRHLADRVSPEWLYQQARRDEVNTFEGCAIRWPINKAVNESSRWQAWKLRQSA